MGADDRLLHPAVSAFEDLAVLVDEKVVADVVPAVSEHVVGLDSTDDRGGLRARVIVRARRVVDDREVDAVGDLGTLLPVPADRLVRAPLRPGDERRRVGRERLHALRRSAKQWAPDEERAQPLHSAGEPVLDLLGAPGPERVAEMPAAASSRLGGVPVGEVVGLRRRKAPPAPGPVRALCPEANGSRSLPVQTDEIEGVRRPRDNVAARRQVASDQVRRRHRDRRRGKEEHEYGAKQLHAAGDPPPRVAEPRPGRKANRGVLIQF